MAAEMSCTDASLCLDVDVALLDGTSGAPLDSNRCDDAVLQQAGQALKLAADSDANSLVEVLPASPGHLLLRLHLDGSVSSARELRDRILSGDFEATALRNLSGSSLSLRVDRSGLAEHYEESVLALDSLTPHQQEKLQQCLQDDDHVHLQAPAGAGKTYVALHRALAALQDPDRTSDLVLFIARNVALSYFAAAWIAKRIRHKSDRHNILRRLHLLHEPFDEGVQAVLLKGRRIFLEPCAGLDNDFQYALVVIDEAHHVYSDEAARACAESFITHKITRRILLSDLSQSLGRDIAYPAHLRCVTLSEVVRCSKRIVAGAMAFQLGGEEKLLTKCHHESTGPPLKSFLFDVQQGGAEGHAYFQAYAQQTSRALQDVITAFPDLNLHNRVAFVVPDTSFREPLLFQLQQTLANEFPSRRFRLVDAITASADLGLNFGVDEPPLDAHAEGKDLPLGCDLSEENEESDVEWIVCDTIGQLDGLERLIVVAIGLDSVISCEDMQDKSGDVAPLKTRSMLYRAVTRAHLMFVVVNEFLRGGWLEFLGSVRLRDDQDFNSKAELRRTEAKAVEEFVKTELASAFSAAALQEGFSLQDEAISLLVTRASELQENGVGKDAAVAAVMQSWKAADEFAHSAMNHAMKQADLELHSKERFLAVRNKLTLAVMRQETANMHAEALEALRHEVNQEQNALIKDALVSISSGRSLDDVVVSFLIPGVALAMKQCESLAAAAGKALDAWRQTEAQIEILLNEFQDVDEGLQDMGIRLTSDARLSLRVAAAASICKGEAIEQAVDTALQKWRQSAIEEHAERALKEAVEAMACASEQVCCLGASVRLKTAEEGEAGIIRGFSAAEQEWEVLWEGKRKASLHMESDLEVLHSGKKEMLVSLEAVLPMLKDSVVHWKEAYSANLAPASKAVAHRCRSLESQVVAAIETMALERQLHLAADKLANLSLTCLRELWNTPRMHADDGDDGAEEYDMPSDKFESIVRAAITEWEQQEHLQQQDFAQISAALEARANAERIMLTDAAASSLQQRVASFLRRGDDLELAVINVLRDWQRQWVRKQVQQTVWDPSGNFTRKVTGVVRFMPFKRDANEFEYWVLANSFVFLPFHYLGVVSRVSKRWRNVASDPSWKPELVAYAWGSSAVNGLSVDCAKPTLLEFSLSSQIMQISCSDTATFALTEAGTVWFWGQSWLPDMVDDSPEPSRLEELSDVVSVSVTPPGYFHGRGHLAGYSCAAVTRRGDLFTWGNNRSGALLNQEAHVARPSRVFHSSDVWQSTTERVLHASCGLFYIALCIERPPRTEANGVRTDAATSVITFGSFDADDFLHGQLVGRFHRQGPPSPEPKEWPQLLGVPIRQLKAGSFHCCALTTRGELYTFGHVYGKDHSNGNLLGHGLPTDEDEMPPTLVVQDGLGPIAELACSTYTTIAITVDGRVFSWGDSDGNSLGHERRNCHSPTWLRSLRWQKVSHGALSYTNGAVATDEGRVFVWGGKAWEGGIASGRNIGEPSEVSWSGVPSCYRCTSVALAHRHGYLIFRKLP